MHDKFLTLPDNPEVHCAALVNFNCQENLINIRFKPCKHMFHILLVLSILLIYMIIDTVDEVRPVTKIIVAPMEEVKAPRSLDMISNTHTVGI